MNALVVGVEIGTIEDDEIAEIGIVIEIDEIVEVVIEVTIDDVGQVEIVMIGVIGIAFDQDLAIDGEVTGHEAVTV